MIVALRGSSPQALVAAVLLMSRGRQFAQRIEVHIVGDPAEISPVFGPAVVYSPVLASCGVGQRCGKQGLIIFPGPADAPLMVSVDVDGCGPWFRVDRAGRGEHPATAALARLCREASGERRALGQGVCRAMEARGLPVELSLLDLCLNAPLAPLERAALLQRAAAGLLGGAREPALQHALLPGGPLPDPLPSPLALEDALASIEDGRLEAILARLPTTTRPATRSWLQRAARLAEADAEVAALLTGALSLLTPLCALPREVALPSAGPAAEAVARGLPTALGAIGEAQAAHEGLLATFRLFGGRFVEDDRPAVDLAGAPPPADPLERWRWFAEQAKSAAVEADRLWRHVVDPEA